MKAEAPDILMVDDNPADVALVREALRALIERESARRLARLGGSEPDLAAAPRRRFRAK